MALKTDTRPASEELLIKLLRDQDNRARIKESSEEPPREVKLINPGERWMLFLDLLQLILKVIVVLALLGMALYFLSGRRARTGEVASAPVVEQTRSRAGRIGRLVDNRFARPYDRLERLVEERNLFASPDTIFVAEGDVSQNTALNDLRTRLRLVGILLDDKPQAMLEESGQQRTHIVGIQDQVAGATVLSIEEKKVILEYNGEQLELFR